MLQKLTDILSDYFKIGDSYHYTLGRDKEAFAIGTMGLDDFREYSEEDVKEIAAHLIANGVTVMKPVDVTERLPEVNGRYLCNIKSMAFPGCHYWNILWYDKDGFRDGNICEDGVTHWVELPEDPAKEVGGDG